MIRWKTSTFPDCSHWCDVRGGGAKISTWNSPSFPPGFPLSTGSEKRPIRSKCHYSIHWIGIYNRKQRCADKTRLGHHWKYISLWKLGVRRTLTSHLQMPLKHKRFNRIHVGPGNIPVFMDGMASENPAALPANLSNLSLPPPVANPNTWRKIDSWIRWPSCRYWTRIRNWWHWFVAWLKER